MSRRRSPWQKLEDKLIYIHRKPRKQKHIPANEIITYDALIAPLRARWDRMRSRRKRYGRAKKAAEAENL